MIASMTMGLPAEGPSGQRAPIDRIDGKFYRTALTGAIDREDADAVRALLAQGADPNAVDGTNFTGRTPLECAQDAQREDIILILLEGGADPNLPQSHGVKALGRAAERGNVSLMRQLLAFGAEVDGRDSYGATALMQAARGPSSEAIALLLEAGADISLRDGRGYEALALLDLLNERLDEQLAAMDALLKAGADPDAIFDYSHDETILMECCSLGHAAEVRLLLDRGAEGGLKDKDSDTAWHYLAKAGGLASPEDSLETARVLAAHGSLALARNGLGYTPIELACIRGNPGLAARFIEAELAGKESEKGKIAALYPPCMLFLMESSAWSDIDLAALGALVDSFLRSGADLGLSLDLNGRDLLGSVAGIKRLNPFSLRLLEKSALILPENGRSRLALREALMADNAEIVQALIERGADAAAPWEDGRYPLQEARSAQCARALVEAGADLMAPDASGKNVLEIACASGAYSADLVSFYLGNQGLLASVDGGLGELLRSALRGGRNETILLLLERGADPFLRFPDGKNAIHAYLHWWKASLTSEWIEEDSLEVIRALLEKGLDPEAKDVAGESALSLCLAEGENFSPAVRELVESYASAETRTALARLRDRREKAERRNERAMGILLVAAPSAIALTYLGACISFREGLYSRNHAANPLGTLNGIIGMGSTGFFFFGGIALWGFSSGSGQESGYAAAWRGVGILLQSLLIGSLGCIGGMCLNFIPTVRNAFANDPFLYYAVPGLATAAGIGISMKIWNDRIRIQ